MDNHENTAHSSLRKKEDPFLGTILSNRYKILFLVGQGSTTSVYKAQDTQRSDLVAIKILHFQLRSNEMTVRRFEQEIKTTSLLNHVNIVAFRDSGVTEDDEPYLVIEYVDGNNLNHVIQEQGYVDWKRTLNIFVQICAALNTAHQAGIVHRDLKPANIMITRDVSGKELVKVLDFGVAKLLIQGETFQSKTQTGEMLGTLLYMSPEQCMDEDLDGRSDLYSLACVMFEALTGTPPFAARTAFETMNLHLTSAPGKLKNTRPDLHLPKSLDYIIQKATEKDPKRRYQTASALADDLSKILSNENHTLTVAAHQKSNSDVSTIASTRHNIVFSQRFIFVLAAYVLLFGHTVYLVICGVLFTVIAYEWDRKKITSRLNPPASINDPEPIRITKENRIESNARKNNSDQSIEKTGSRETLYFPGYVNLDEHVMRVFDYVDANHDGYIAKDELEKTLYSSGKLNAHDKTFVEFLLNNYSEMKEIFDEQNVRVGISRAEVSMLTRNIDLKTLN